MVAAGFRNVRGAFSFAPTPFDSVGMNPPNGQSGKMSRHQSIWAAENIAPLEPDERRPLKAETGVRFP